MKKIIICLLTSFSICVSAYCDEVLYWMVDNPTIIGWYGAIYKAAEAGEKIAAARVAAFKTADSEAYMSSRIGNPDGTHEEFAGDIVYLDLYYNDGYGNWTLDNPVGQGNDFAVLDDGKFKTYERAAVLASLGDRRLPEYSFAIELGTFAGESGEKWLWAAVSGTETYANLTRYIGQQVDIPYALPWTPNLYFAPEPTAGILVLFGFAFLGLKRQREI